MGNRVASETGSTRKTDWELKQKMFEKWCETQNLREVARFSGLSVEGVRTLSESEDWQKRFNRIAATIQSNADERIVKKISSNLEKVQELKDRLFKKIMARGGLKYPKVADLLAAMEYEDKLLGNTGGAAPKESDDEIERRFERGLAMFLAKQKDPNNRVSGVLTDE